MFRYALYFEYQADGVADRAKVKYEKERSRR